MIDFSVGHKLFDEDRSVDDVRLRCTCCLNHDLTRAHHLSVSSILKRVVSLLILGVFRCAIGMQLVVMHC